MFELSLECWVPGWEGNLLLSWKIVDEEEASNKSAQLWCKHAREISSWAVDPSAIQAGKGGEGGFGVEEGAQAQLPRGPDRRDRSPTFELGADH